MTHPCARLIALAFLLAATACSSGVSEEDYQAALDAEREANARLATAEADNDALSGQLSDVEGDLQSSRAEANDLVARIDELMSAVDAGRTDLAAAEEAIDELRRLAALTKADGATLRSVQAARTVRCGIQGSMPGFSVVDEFGRASGFDVEICRAIAAAAIGDADAVEYVPVSARDRFLALQSGLIDVLVRNTTHTLARSADEGLDFGPTVFHDGQQFIGAVDVYGQADVTALDGARVCVAPDSIYEERAMAAAQQHDVALTTVAASNLFEGLGQLADGSCDVVTGEGSALAATAERSIEEGRFPRGSLTIFPNTPISKEPLAPAVLQGDTLWADVVDWAVYAMLVAEEKGVTSANVDSVQWDEATRRLFGEMGDSPGRWGLSDDAFYQVIRQVGSYAEIYERHLEPIGLPRTGTLNLLWTEGGLLHAPRV